MRHDLVRLVFGLAMLSCAEAPDTAMPVPSALSGTSSVYLSVPTDKVVASTTPQPLLSTTITASGRLLVHSDGRFYPGTPATNGSVYIEVDGIKVSNDSYIQWADSSSPAQHSFNCVGAPLLSAGSHVVRLMGVIHSSTPGGRLVVGKDSNLAVMISPAARVMVSALAEDSHIVNVNTLDQKEFSPIPTSDPGAGDPALLTHSIPTGPASGPIIALASGRAYGVGCPGDAMWGIYLSRLHNGTYQQHLCPSNDNAAWSVNDLYAGAEQQAPLFTHAFYDAIGPLAGSDPLRISLRYTEAPWGLRQTGDYADITYPGLDDGKNCGVPAGRHDNTVRYRVGASTTMVTLNGGMQVFGKAAISTASCSFFDYLCIGSSDPVGVRPSNCPGLGRQLITQRSFQVPPGHSGVVLFLAKTRIQADGARDAGNVLLSLELDGSDVGSVGIQQINAGNGASERTLSASYMSAGANRLSQGWHTISVHAQADPGTTGYFKHPSLTQGVPLIYFD